MTDYSNWILKDKHEKLLFGPVLKIREPKAGALL